MIPFEILFDGNFRDTWEAKDAFFSQEMINLLKLLEVRISPNMLAIYNDDDDIPKSDFKEYCSDKLLADINTLNYPKKCELYHQKVIYHY